MEFLLLSVVGLVKDACSEATVVEEAVRDLEGGGLGLGKLKGPRPQKTGKPKQPQKPEPKPRKPQEPKPQQKKPQQKKGRSRSRFQKESGQGKKSSCKKSCHKKQKSRSKNQKIC